MCWTFHSEICSVLSSAEVLLRAQRIALFLLQHGTNRHHHHFGIIALSFTLTICHFNIETAPLSIHLWKHITTQHEIVKCKEECKQKVVYRPQYVCLILMYVYYKYEYEHTSVRVIHVSQLYLATMAVQCTIHTAVSLYLFSTFHYDRSR